MDLAFRLDLSLYYWGVVEPVFHTGEAALLAPPFSPPSGKIFAVLMGLITAASPASPAAAAG